MARGLSSSCWLAWSTGISIEPSSGTLVTALDVSADDELVALGDEDGRVAPWRARTGAATGRAVDVPRGDELWGVRALDFHPDGTRLAIGGGDCRARGWNLADSSPERELSHCDDDVFGGLAIGHVAFSPDGQRLATTSFTWWATRVCDVESGRRVAGYHYDFGNPCSRTATFTPDGALVVAELGGAVVDVATDRARHVLEPQPALQRVTSYRTANGIAWTERAGLLRVCDGASGTVVLERATRWSSRQD